jgi:hypothetical protein
VDEIDRELASALSIEASPEFRARVRERIAREPAPRSWHLPWGTAGVGVAAVAVAIVLVVGRIDPTGSARKPGGPPPERPPLPSTTLTAWPVSFPALRSAVAAIRRPSRDPEPEVLVAPSEVRGLHQLAALVREGRAQFVFPDEDAHPVLPEPVSDIVIAPIAITPLDIAAHSDAGLNSEGDEP